jgi:uncharacterized caspase-like protein
MASMRPWKQMHAGTPPSSLPGVSGSVHAVTSNTSDSGGQVGRMDSCLRAQQVEPKGYIRNVKERREQRRGSSAKHAAKAAQQEVQARQEVSIAESRFRALRGGNDEQQPVHL